MKTNFWVMGLILLVLCNLSHAYDRLYVSDPRGWRGGTGTIEEAVISVKPRGLYMECGLYLTFSARGLNFSNSDTLEIQFKFDLPEGSIVHDSWLWIEDEIIKAEIMDKWTAQSIYEDIVKRRRDPSILYKIGQRSYELRIFPMAGEETRKIKITYLVPTQWNFDEVIAPLPINLLRTSRYNLEKFYFLTWLNEQWKNPKIIEFSDLTFKSEYDSLFGNYLRLDLPSESLYGDLNFVVDAPLTRGVYLSTFNTDNKGYYQLALLPAQALDLSARYKATILVDFDASKSNVTKVEILSMIKSLLHSNFSPEDSFNLIFSQLNTYRFSESWLPADSMTIENTFNQLNENDIASYSNLPSLLANGIEFVKDNGNDGSLVLISNSDQVGDFEVANQLIDDLMELMDSPLPIHVSDFQQNYFSSRYIGGRYYRGNEYFYTNITRLTTGNLYRSISGLSFSEVTSSAIHSLSGFISSFDLHTKLGNGFCYGRIYLSDESNSVYLNRPILQIGQFNGSLPFVIEASGVYQSNVFSQELQFIENEQFKSDSLSAIIWAGNHIKSLELESPRNDIVSEIIDYSISKRILSYYTAFLCLEPSRGGQVCYDCMDETELLTSINESFTETDRDSTFIAYPNPFNSQIKINLRIPDIEMKDEISFTIHNILGQVVRTFKPENSQNDNNYVFTWNGQNDRGETVSTGNYFFVASTTNNKYIKKLLLIR